MRIVETDNFGRDYPDEKFVNIPSIYEEDHAQAVCDSINIACSGPNASRWWKVVPNDYKLQPGFEP
jgi:hypothetical protein